MSTHVLPCSCNPEVQHHGVSERKAHVRREGERRRGYAFLFKLTIGSLCHLIEVEGSEYICIAVSICITIFDFESAKLPVLCVH